ncbi:hypothetical protein BAE44_0003110 [Dichanthelium oligosanthes]|uniref:Gnk2-homologous domain-containing protein n=1 Tax=Dichanthelium oligosanthes TaxID=888268 RepID=A0A1E5WEP7_9POAL|nr:hypothetical protein BAE44_0003110 [Dichanthelium oligosanthes]
MPLVQCLEDLSKVDCTLCYSEIRSLLPKCYPEIGGRIYLDGCFRRYANYYFFDESNKGFAVSSVSRSPKFAAYALAQCWENLNTSSCAACLSAAAASVANCAPAEEVLSSSVGVILVLILSVFACQKKKARKARERSLRGLCGSELPAIISQSSLNFSYKDLKKATCSFSLANKIGQSSNGTVYKAVLPGGNEVAVKRLFLNTKQCIDQFFNEDVISQLMTKAGIWIGSKGMIRREKNTRLSDILTLLNAVLNQQSCGLLQVWHSYKANTTEKIVDAPLQQQVDAFEEITRVVQVRLLCTQANPYDWLAMSRVVELLRDRDGARGDAEFVLGDPDVAGGSGASEASTLLPCTSTSDEPLI